MNIDQHIDYKSFYSQFLKNIKCSGSQLSSRCPFHEEKNNSFSVNLITGQWSCFTEGIHGNVYDFYARIKGLSAEMAKEQLYKDLGIEREEIKKEANKKEEKKGPALTDYSLDQYSNDKNIQRGYLEQIWGLSEGQRRKVLTVKIPYFDQNGQIVATRYRHAKTDDPRFEWEKGSNTGTLYGLQILETIKEDKYTLICEGESDVQTLSWLGFDALGAPGASTINAKQIAPLAEIEGLKVYLHVENDNGGETFLRKAKEAFREIDFKGELYIFRCSDKGAKDPSELYINNADTAQELIKELLSKAELVNLAELPLIPETIKGAPVNLRVPDGYHVSDEGIGLFDKEGLPLPPFLSTPIMFSKFIDNLESGEQKVEVTVKRLNKFSSMIMPRTDFTATNIIKLASMTGAIITSANAKNVIQYLTKLEDINKDIIPTGYSVEHFGWIENEKEKFYKFLPYCADNISLEFGDPKLERACQTKGTLENWIAAMQPHRERYIFRFILASSFAAPLLKPLKQRSFVVYNWADSRGGKTATLKAALSVWGDPGSLMMTFNATRNYLEAKAITLCDLPLGIDERQQAANPEDVTNLFYMLGNETERGRMNKNLDVKALKNWRTVAITTGEEPASSDCTMEGAKNRTIELLGAPFEGLEDEAMKIHQTCADNCGNAGQKYIQVLKEQVLSSQQKIKQLEDVFKNIHDLANKEIIKVLGKKNLSHASMLATVATADIISSVYIFGEDEKTASEEAYSMIKNVIKDMKSSAIPDVNINACNDIFDFWQGNRNQFFCADNPRTMYGFDDGEGVGKIRTPPKTLYIFPKFLKENILGDKYSTRKVLDFAAKNGILKLSPKGEKYISVYNPNTQRQARAYAFNISKLSELSEIKTDKTDKREEHYQHVYIDVEENNIPF